MLSALILYIPALNKEGIYWIVLNYVGKGSEVGLVSECLPNLPLATICGVSR